MFIMIDDQGAIIIDDEKKDKERAFSYKKTRMAFYMLKLHGFVG